MKKYTKIIVLFSIALIIIVTMYIVGNQVDIGIPPIGNLNTSNPIVMEFEKDCNKIGKASWDYSAYVNLKSKLETFSNGSNASLA